MPSEIEKIIKGTNENLQKKLDAMASQAKASMSINTKKPLKIENLPKTENLQIIKVADDKCQKK